MVSYDLQDFYIVFPDYLTLTIYLARQSFAEKAHSLYGNRFLLTQPCTMHSDMNTVSMICSTDYFGNPKL